MLFSRFVQIRVLRHCNGDEVSIAQQRVPIRSVGSLSPTWREVGDRKFQAFESAASIGTVERNKGVTNNVLKEILKGGQHSSEEVT